MIPPDVAGLAAPGTVGIAGIDDPLRVVADAADFARTQTAYPHAALVPVAVPPKAFSAAATATNEGSRRRTAVTALAQRRREASVQP